MVEGKKHGKGLLKDKDDWQYEGEFYFDVITGQGQMIYVNDDVYSGVFKDGMRHGNG